MSILNKLNRNDVEKTFNQALKNKNNLVKKARKLKRDPELFFKDMYTKRSKQLISKIPIKYDGQNQFTVVSAVYNVEKYLDDYFASLTNQTLDFKKHIHLIMVDDGSTDNSAQIIKKWQKKYPDNIHYLYKENGGQASARDYGLDYIQTKWCTFIDPDDFVDINYFKSIDEAIIEQKDLWMISCNLVYYYEQSKQYKDNHPQNYKFKQKITCFDVRDQHQYIQLSVSLAILNTEIIQTHKLRFDTRIKPSFEDATFMMNYALALHQKQGRVAFVKDAKYYYRKREDGSSTLDTGWVKPSGYDEVLRYGCIKTLQLYQESLGYIPRFIQTSVMYYHIWQIKGIVNDDDTLNFLTKEQKDEYLLLLKQMFSYIDEESIDTFNLAGTWMFEKAGMLNLYKNQAPRADLQIAYIEKYDATKNQILLYYFAPKGSEAVFYNQGIAIEPQYKKILRHSFLEHAFVYEYRYWIPLSDDGNISLEIDGNPTKIGFAGQHIRTPIASNTLKSYYLEQDKYPNINNTWVIMDRDIQADDNAEHFYRYVMTHHPQQKIYFALRRDSHDWDRLEKEGFNLLDFGSVRFETELKNCSKIISSHIDDYIVDYFGDKGLIGKDFVFLPHGVTQNDLHGWYNSKVQYMSLMTVATHDEYHSIADDNNHYKYGKKEIKLTGLPRHDALLRGNQFGTKRIVVMPTWRKYLLGKHNSNTGIFEKNPNFMQSDYAQKWQSFLASDELQRLIRDYGYEVVFAPHKNTEAYLDEFKLPANITIWKANPNESIQKLFQTADLMVTDYSSVAFEMGYLGKTVLYYQFDFEEFFKGQWQRGYFDYHQHGFGAVSDNEAKLLADLEAVLINGGRALPEYQHRIDNTFAYRDENNCERVYGEIIELDSIQPTTEYSQEFFQQLLSYARKHQVWRLLESLNTQTLSTSTLTKQIRSTLEQEVCHAMSMQGKYQELMEFLPTTTLEPTKQKYWQIKMDFWLQKYDDVIGYFQTYPPKTNEDKIINLLALAYLGNDDYQICKNTLSQNQLSSVQTVLVEVSEAIYHQDHKRVIAIIHDALKSDVISWDRDDNQIYKPNIILANTSNAEQDYNLSYGYINQHNNKLGFIDYASNVVSAQMDYGKGSYQYAIEHYETLLGYGISLAAKDEICYLKSLCYEELYEKIEQLNDDLFKQDDDLLSLWMNLQIQHKNWDGIIQMIDGLNNDQKSSFSTQSVLAHYRSGRIDEAYQIITRSTHKDDDEYWSIVMEVALLHGDTSLAKYAYRELIIKNPDKVSVLTEKFNTYTSIGAILNN